MELNFQEILKIKKKEEKLLEKRRRSVERKAAIGKEIGQLPPLSDVGKSVSGEG